MHWSIVFLVALSWWSAEESSDQAHFWSGYALLFLLLFRVLWGLAGSSTARFAGFVRGPASVAAYLKSGQHSQAGHTPLGALSVVAMLAVLVVQVATGLVQLDEDDFVEGPLASVVDYETSVLAHEVHEVSFNVLLGLIALHLLAVAYYVLVRRRGLVRAMITGHGELPDGVSPMQPASGRSLLACAVAAFGLTAAIVGAVPVFVD